jgi:alpha-glucosidase
MLTLYRAALRLRHTVLTADAAFEWLPSAPAVLAFRRGPAFGCVLNLGDEPVALPAGDVLLTSHELDGDLLPPDAAAWLRLNTAP